MIQNFVEMINQADMLNGCTTREDNISVCGENVDVVIVSVVVDDMGNSIEAVFHKGTETLIDMNIKHICMCKNNG